MDTVWLHLGSLTLRAPETAAMNLVMAVQCAVYARSLSGMPGGRARGWRGFFLAMSVATLAGAPKHALRHLMSGNELLVLLWISNAMGALATLFAQRASIAAHLPPGTRSRRRLEMAARVQLAAFLLANVVAGPELLFLVGDMALGLVPVIVAETCAGRRGSVSGRWVAAGLLLSLGTGVIYVTRLSPGRWFNHIDLAHGLMAVSFHLLFLGAHARAAPAGVPGRTRARRAPSWS